MQKQLGTITVGAYLDNQMQLLLCHALVFHAPIESGVRI